MIESKNPSFTPDARVLVAGHTGLVGSAIVRQLREKGFKNFIFASIDELDLRDQASVESFFQAERPQFVFLAAAKVGGILANSTYPAQFIRDNLAIATNIIHACYKHGATKLLNLGSSCIYPKLATQPMAEAALLTGPLEPTNRPYAVAKIAAIEMCDSYRREYGCDFISAMPTNTYGPGDNFDLETSHVLPALIRKFHDGREQSAQRVVLWGTGKPLREFIFVDDLADALVYLMKHFSGPGPVNVGTGKDISIKELAKIVADVVGFQGEIVWDTTKPDGTLRKLLDVSRLSQLGFEARTPLRKGIQITHNWYQQNGE